MCHPHASTHTHSQAHIHTHTHTSAYVYDNAPTHTHIKTLASTFTFYQFRSLQSIPPLPPSSVVPLPLTAPSIHWPNPRSFSFSTSTHRRNAVGDQLRAVYDQLARDPNSLANLDQDLPNYAQHIVPIHSLPQVQSIQELFSNRVFLIFSEQINLSTIKTHFAKTIIFRNSWQNWHRQIRNTLIKSKQTKQTK